MLKDNRLAFNGPSIKTKKGKEPGKPPSAVFECKRPRCGASTGVILIASGTAQLVTNQGPDGKILCGQLVGALGEALTWSHKNEDEKKIKLFSKVDIYPHCVFYLGVAAADDDDAGVWDYKDHRLKISRVGVPILWTMI